MREKRRVFFRCPRMNSFSWSNFFCENAIES